jgi:hypothetical protein
MIRANPLLLTQLFVSFRQTSLASGRGYQVRFHRIDHGLQYFFHELLNLSRQWPLVHRIGRAFSTDPLNTQKTQEAH